MKLRSWLKWSLLLVSLALLIISGTMVVRLLHQGAQEQEGGPHLKQRGHHAVHRLGPTGELLKVWQEQGAPQGYQSGHGSGGEEQRLAPQLGKFTPQKFKQCPHPL